MSQLE